MRDAVLVCLLILTVAASSFAGSALAVYAIHTKDAADMVALRAQAEPSVVKLFTAAGEIGCAVRY